MINAPYAEQAFEHLYKFWRFENHRRPAIAITSKNPDYTYKKIKTPEKIIDRWLDIEYVISINRDRLNRTLFFGDALPYVNLNLGPDVFAALYGCEVIHDDRTSWAVHDNTRPLKEYDLSKVDEQGFWWKKTMEMTKALVEESNGDYLVGVTDIHAGLDALVSLRGPEQVCLDLYDEPHEVKRLCMELFEGFKKYFNQICGIIEIGQKGHVNWLGPWSDKRWYVTSCDFIYMISEESKIRLEELKEYPIRCVVCDKPLCDRGGKNITCYSVLFNFFTCCKEHDDEFRARPDVKECIELYDKFMNMKFMCD